MEAIFSKFKEHLANTLSFANYTKTMPAKYVVNAKETGTCTICGETYEGETTGTTLELLFV